MMELDELLDYFKGCTLPKGLLRINAYMTIGNVPQFILDCEHRYKVLKQQAGLTWLRDLRKGIEKSKA